MIVTTLTKKAIEAILPKHILTDKRFDNDSRRLLATLMYHFNTNEKAKETGYLIINNFDLIKALGWKYNGSSRNRLLSSITILELYNLIERETGKKWKKGEKPSASKYFINWENLCKTVEDSPCGMVK